MANYTENYDLTLPEKGDSFNVADMNTNFSAVDATLYANEQAVTNAGEKIDTVGEKVDAVGTKVDTANNRIGTSTASDTSTLFGQLNSIRSTLSGGSSPVKSIQRITYTLTADARSATITINTVNTSKTFVIMERLNDQTTALTSVSYTLAASSLAVSTGVVNSNYPITLGFWIIEFN